MGHRRPLQPRWEPCVCSRGQRGVYSPNAEWKAQSLHSTRGAAAGCWQVEGVPRGPGGYTEAQDPLSDRTYGPRGRQPARARLSWTPECLAGREVCRARGGHRWSVVKPLASSGLIRPQCSCRARLHLRGKRATSRARPAAHLAGGRVPPCSEQLVGGPSEKCWPCSAPRRPRLS